MASLNQDEWDELKAEGRVVFDHPGRKLAIYPNRDGGVIFMSVIDGEVSHFDALPDEYAAIADSMSRAMLDARGIECQRESEYETHLALERAREH